MAADGIESPPGPMSLASVWRMTTALIVVAQGVAIAATSGGGIGSNALARDVMVLAIASGVALVGVQVLSTDGVWLRGVLAALEALALVGAVLAGRDRGSDGPIYFVAGLRFTLVGYAHDPVDLASVVMWAMLAAVALAYACAWPGSPSLQGRRAIRALSAVVVVACAATSFAWYEQARLLTDSIGGWNGIEGHADLGYGTDAPIEGLTIVDEHSGSTTTADLDRNGWLRVALPPGPYRLTLCMQTPMTTGIEVVVPVHGLASVSDDAVAPLRDRRGC